MKWFGFIVFLFLAVPGTSFANIVIERLPAGPIVNIPITVNFSFLNTDLLDDDNDSSSYCIALESEFAGTIYQSELPFARNNTMSGIATFTNINDSEVIYTIVAYGNEDNQICDPAFGTSGFYALLEGDEITPIFIIDYSIIYQQNNEIWGSTGIFGTTTNIATIVASGVTSTGRAIWPLFIFLGVGIVFVIFIYIQDFIMGKGDQSAVPTRRKSRRSGSYKAFKKGKKELPGLWQD